MKKIYILVSIVLFTLSCERKDGYLLSKEQIGKYGTDIGADYVLWKADDEHTIDGFLFVNDGQTLEIEPGTVIKSKEGKAYAASALIVARGGKIIAKGTAQKPIIFTSEKDDLKGTLNMSQKGLWGGIIILGNAPVSVLGDIAIVEGLPIDEPRAEYGGNNPEDNSGVLEYVSIRYAGVNIGSGDEINGLTLGGVGNKTTINHVEVVACADDGIEIFGGTVNMKNIAVAFSADDAFDYDFGYSGKSQFLFCIQDKQGDNLVEHSGSRNSSDSAPIFMNLTCIGSGSESGQNLISMTNSAQAKYYNSIFYNQDNGIILEDSYVNFKSEKILFQNNLFYQVAENKKNDLLKSNSVGSEVEIVSILDKNLNNIVDFGFSKIGDTYIVKPTIDQSAIFIKDEFFDKVNFVGAFGSVNWLQGWSIIDSEKIIKL